MISTELMKAFEEHLETVKINKQLIESAVKTKTVYVKRISLSDAMLLRKLGFLVIVC